MGLDLSGNGSPETMYDEGDRNLAVGLYRVGNNSVVDHRRPTARRDSDISANSGGEK